jgi:hypothetical protein
VRDEVQLRDGVAWRREDWRGGIQIDKGPAEERRRGGKSRGGRRRDEVQMGGEMVG